MLGTLWAIRHSTPATAGPLAWKTLPCWYLLGTQDKAIPPALQRFMAEHANATIVEVAASPRLVRVPARGRDPAHPPSHPG
jgi:pimeloyl-ACP methyl ester carboxylesterase